jgi:hypothetical protein
LVDDKKNLQEMNIPEGTHRRVLSLCEVDFRANSAKIAELRRYST